MTPGDTYKVISYVTITNHAPCPSPPCPAQGPDTKASFTWLTTPNDLINNNINVHDSNGYDWAFSASGSQGYDKTFTTSATSPDTQKFDNTATITETGQSASASVTVNVYRLGVTKDATTSFTRTYNWNIQKTGDQTALTLAIGQSFLVNYVATVGASHTDSDWAVSGNIYVHNPAPIDATINSVSDVVSPAIAPNVNFDVTFPYTLAAGTTLTGTYSASLPDATARTNTATATLQNYAYDYLKSGTASGTTDFTGSAAVNFANPTKEVDKTVTVTDAFNGAQTPVTLGTLTYGVDTLPHAYTYYNTIPGFNAPGAYNVPNTASYITSDTGTTGSSSWNVKVNVPSGGCSLTIGYWKTHAGFGPQKDMVTPLLPITLGTTGGTKSVTVTTASQAVTLLSFGGSNSQTDASNGINKLYAQLLGTQLNIKNGADGSAVASTISAANGFLATHDSTNWSILSKADKTSVLGWMTTLDNYNTGLMGVGHCSA